MGKYLILCPMREKALRLLMSILFLTGSLAAYPQNNFPENVRESIAHWQQVLNFPNDTKAGQLEKDWMAVSTDPLSKIEYRHLSALMGIADLYMDRMEKKERQFMFKQAHLAIHLSGFNPMATGSFDRKGLWMLSYPDARRYGLQVDEFIDERFDIVKSTQAARLYFEDLKKIHGGNTEAAFVLGTAGYKKADSTMVVSIEENLTNLRLVNRAFEATKEFSEKDNYYPISFDGKVQLAVLQQQLDLTEEQFRLANPTHVGHAILPKTKVNLPTENIDADLVGMSLVFQKQQKHKLDSIMQRMKKNIPSPETHRAVTYKVKSGDVLGRIAQRHGVSISKLKKWNELRSDRIDINQKLTIYVKKGRKITKPTLAKAVPPKPEVKLSQEEKAKFTIYEVQPGDTLWAISKKFSGVKPEQIMEWNDIGEDLSIGQKLKIKTL